jgi:hypothetical protein
MIYGGGYLRGYTIYAYLLDGKVRRIVCDSNLGLGLEVPEVKYFAIFERFRNMEQATQC